MENDRFTGQQLLKETRVGFKYGKGTSLKLDAFAHILPTVCDKAIEHLETLAGADKPFFIYLAPCAPHDPYVPTAAWKGKSGLGAYADYVMETDAEIGRFLAALDKTGQADKTLVIFTSDNGCAPYAGVRSMENQGHYPSADRRGYKADAWDGGHRIPLIVRWPGMVKPGTQCHRLVCLNDFMATCAEITGAKLSDNAGEDSISLFPLLRGEDKPVRETLVHHSFHGNFAIRDGQWKLVLCPGSGGWSSGPKTPTVQLYDMSVDIGERNNLEAEHPDVVKRLTEKLGKIVAAGRSTPGPKQKNDVMVDIFKRQAAGKPADK
jgi:arylsulfatase A-like enzyme